MGTLVEIDEIDKKILGMLIADARVRLKDVAKACEISSVSVLKRIKRLRVSGVILGATVLPNLDFLGHRMAATIGIEANTNQDQVVRFLEEHTHVVDASTCIGKYDLISVVLTEDIYHLERVVGELKKISGIRRVTVNVWSGKPQFTLENIDLQPRKRDCDGKT